MSQANPVRAPEQTFHVPVVLEVHRAVTLTEGKHVIHQYTVSDGLGIPHPFEERIARPAPSWPPQSVPGRKFSRNVIGTEERGAARTAMDERRLDGKPKIALGRQITSPRHGRIPHRTPDRVVPSRMSPWMCFALLGFRTQADGKHARRQVDERERRSAS